MVAGPGARRPFTMIPHSLPRSQRQQIKQQLGQRETATVAGLDDWLDGVSNGSCLSFKFGKDGTRRASSQPYIGFGKKPPKPERIGFRDMVQDLAGFHAKDPEGSVARLAQLLVTHCQSAHKGLHKDGALRDVVRQLRQAIDARQNGQADSPVQDDSASSGPLAVAEPDPAEPLEPSHQQTQRAQWLQRAEALRTQIAKKQPATGDKAQERFAKDSAKAFAKAQAAGRCERGQWLAYYLDNPALFSMQGVPRWLACQHLLNSLDESRLLGLLPAEHVAPLIDELQAFKAWEHDPELATLRDAWLERARQWRTPGEDVPARQIMLRLQISGVWDLLQRFKSGRAPAHTSLFFFLLSKLSAHSGGNLHGALDLMETLLDDGLLAVLPEDSAQELIDQFVQVRVSVQRGWSVTL